MLGVPGGGSPIQCLGLVKVNSQRGKNGNADQESVPPHPTWGTIHV